MWHLYSWTSVTEMAKWSTTGFSLQCQSLMNQTSQDENYNNNRLEDIVLMYQQILRTLMWREMKDSEGELKMVKIWSLFKYIYWFTRLKKLKFKLASRTMSSQILLALGKSWFTYFEFLVVVGGRLHWARLSAHWARGNESTVLVLDDWAELFLSPGL